MPRTALSTTVRRDGPSPARMAWSALALSMTLSVSGTWPAAAQLVPTHLVVLDQDAHDVSLSAAGALFSVDTRAGSAADPTIEAATDQGAPFEFVSGLELSPFDGAAYVTDLGAGTALGSVYAIDGATGGIRTVITGDGMLPDPFDVAFVLGGAAGRRLLVVDWDADPSGLGPDSFGGSGHGALFWLDETTGALTVLSDGTSYPPTLPGVVDSAFEDPVAVAYDAVRDVLYVCDVAADPLGLAYAGAVYAVDPSTGAVTLASSNDQFLSLIGVDVRQDGTPLVADSVRDDSIVWTIDVSNSDPETNARVLSWGSQYALVEGVGIDGADRVYVVDSGEYNAGTGMFDIPPAVFRLDETQPDPYLNAVLVNESDELVTPVSIDGVPAADPNSVDPPSIAGAGCGSATTADVRVLGDDLAPWLLLDFGPMVAVNSVGWGDASMSGTSLAVNLTAAAGVAGLLDLLVTHPFGGAQALPRALEITLPGPPCSTVGDASCDGVVDGIDLAILGMHFAQRNCIDPGFWNDADFNDDQVIDGGDLAILATFFGTRP